MPVGVTAVVVLAAGAGTRMKSSIPKVMHPLAGTPLIWHALAAAQQVGPERIVAVIGHGREQVSAFLAAELPDVRTVVQDQQLGTGHAVECALAELGDVTGTLLVTYGDVPLLRAETLTLPRADSHRRRQRGHGVDRANSVDPTGYGRIVRDVPRVPCPPSSNSATRPLDQRAITEVNTGVYAFDATVLVTALSRLTSSNSQGERYLTDVVGIVGADGGAVGTVTVDDADRDRRRQRPGPARRPGPGAERAAGPRRTAGRGHRAGSADDLAARRRPARAGRHHPAQHVVGGRHRRRSPAP